MYSDISVSVCFTFMLKYFPQSGSARVRLDLLTDGSPRQKYAKYLEDLFTSE